MTTSFRGWESLLPGHLRTAANNGASGRIRTPATQFRSLVVSLEVATGRAERAGRTERTSADGLAIRPELRLLIRVSRVRSAAPSPLPFFPDMTPFFRDCV